MALSEHRGAGLMTKPSSNRFHQSIMGKAIPMVILQTLCLSPSCSTRAIFDHTEPTSSFPPGFGDKTMTSLEDRL